ncbi:hypothetical protein B7494_g283 [Chlorociboria aeruginascens]|nr:hypothetical protein B7494_g283 [Chlorociboria aeruginascens]
MDSSGRPKKAGKSRIPDHLRRRTLVSCDRCKKRRIRCIKAVDAHGQESCQSCLDIAVTCESTLPRKTRIYGSVETLSLRYRVLDALIKGLYPQRDTDNIDTLYEIAESQDIMIPDLSGQISSEGVFSKSPPRAESTPPRRLEDAGPLIAENAPMEASSLVPEQLVPTPHDGPSHYIGPSSSFGFVLTVRSMVSEFTAALNTVQADDERTKISSDFAGSNWSKALEPKANDQLPPVAQVGGRYRKSHISSGEETAFPIQNPEANRIIHQPNLLSSYLPPRQTADLLVQAFFDHVHPNYLIFHRETFELRYESTWTQALTGIPIHEIEPGWVCCLFMVLAFGAQVIVQDDKEQYVQMQRRYLDLVKLRVYHLISSSSLVNIQALLLLQLHQHNCAERNTAFLILGCTIRMATALGMHREGTLGGFDNMEREVRRRVWWTLYMFEHLQCTILGRPCSIDDTEVNITFPNETMLDGCENVPPGYTEFSVRLTRLMADTRKKIYFSPSNPTQQGQYPKVSVVMHCLLNLDAWYQSLPNWLRLENPSLTSKHRRAVVVLHLQFHNIQALTTRPFILRKAVVQLARKLGKHVPSQDLDDEELRFSALCGSHSKESVLLCHQLLMSGMFEGVGWLDAYYVYHSVFILALDFLARPDDEPDSPEDSARKSAVREIMNTIQNTQLCPTLAILTRVALQFAKIVGIFDVQGEEFHAANHEHYHPPTSTPYTISNTSQVSTSSPNPSYAAFPHAQAANNTQSPASVSHLVNTWFQRETGALKWNGGDIFNLENYSMPLTMGNFMAEPQNPSIDLGMGIGLSVAENTAAAAALYAPWVNGTMNDPLYNAMQHSRGEAYQSQGQGQGQGQNQGEYKGRGMH